MTTPRLNLLMIRAADVERAVAFYRELGLPFERERHGSGPVHYAAKCDGTVLEIYPARLGEFATSSMRLGFCVPDVAQSTTALLAAGGVLQGSVGRMRSVVIDPDGNRVELTAAGAASPASADLSGLPTGGVLAAREARTGAAVLVPIASGSRPERNP